MANYKKKEHYFVKYPDSEPIEVSEEVYRVWAYGVNKERALRKAYYTKAILSEGTYVSVPSSLVSIYEGFLEETLCDNTYNPQDTFEKELQLETLVDALKQMPEQYRIVIHLIYFCNYTETEIAKLIGIRQSSVHGRKERALRWLREYFKARDLHIEDFNMWL